MKHPQYEERHLLDFWFGAATADGGYEHQLRWFRADPAFDAECSAQYADLCARAARGELDALQASAEGSLALVLLLDQLPRNIHRGRPEAFAADEKARAVARGAIERGVDRELPKLQRLFLYLPFEHSESLADQDLALELIAALGDEEQTYWARRHRDAIARFGRFPHRNAILGRDSTAEEMAFLNSPDSSFFGGFHSARTTLPRSASTLALPSWGGAERVGRRGSRPDTRAC